jgi:hypothetical protein
MAQQLIFTSTPQGLEPGRSGYCTVARHKDLRQRLVRELERLSVYDFGQQIGGNRVDISVYRKIALGSEEFFVLTKICDAGMDYTNRTNYLAHHLILDGFEIATCPSPAEIFLNWNGWKRKWEEGPRYLTPGEEVTLTGFKSTGLVPCKNWLSFTNDPGNASSLVSQSMVVPIVIENVPNQSSHLLQLFAESSALLKISLDAWDFSFTTFLQGNDDPKSFAWLGVEGQPAGERLKQGGVRNYIDLREWTASALSDDLDPALSHVARKGPSAPPTKRVKKGASSNTRSPLSDMQVDKIKGTSSAYLSTAPSGSTVAPQQNSSKKTKKKRPWLLQLAVISTALCLLGALIVGLAYNLGDWFNQEELGVDSRDEPIVTNLAQDEHEKIDKKPIAIGAFAQLNEVEYLRVLEKPSHLRWLKVDVGTIEPVKVIIEDENFVEFESALLETDIGDELKVVIQKNEKGLFFEDIKRASPPSSRGTLKEITFEDGEHIELSRLNDEISFSLEGKTFYYDIRRAESEKRARIEELSELIVSGNKIPFNFRTEGQKVISIDSFDLPTKLSGQVSVREEDTKRPSGTERVISLVGGDDSLYFEKEQMRIGLPVEGTSRKYYLFKEEESSRIEELSNFSKSGEGKMDLTVMVKGDQITQLEFEIPEVSVGPIKTTILSPAELSVRKRILFWIPGVSGNTGWRIDESLKSFDYKDPETANLLFSYFKSYHQNSDKPKVWMCDYINGKLFESNPFSDASKVEEFTFEYQEGTNRVDLIKRADVSFKYGTNGYSFDFVINEGQSIDISYNANHAWNSINNGKVIRLPLVDGSNECIDLYLLSNKHSNFDGLNELGYSYSLQDNRVFSGDSRLNSKSFKFLFSGNRLKILSLSALDSAEINLEVMFRDYTRDDFVNKGRLKDLPAILKPSELSPLEGVIKLDLDYFPNVTKILNLLKSQYESVLPEDVNDFPDTELYESFKKYALEHAYLSPYEPGLPVDQFLYSIPLVFIQKNFGWDDIRFQNLKNKLDLRFKQPELSLNPELLVSYWTAITEEINDYFLDSFQKDFDYGKDDLEKHMKLIFDSLTLILKIEQLYGVSEGGVLDRFKAIRGTLDSFDNDESPIVIFNNEVARLEKVNPEVRDKFKDYMSNYLALKKSCIPSERLNLNSLRLVLKTISDRGKNSLYLGSKDKIQGYKNAIALIKLKINEIQNKQNQIITQPNFQVVDRKLKIIRSIPWTFAIYQKGLDGKWIKESDFLRLAPPTKL